MIRIAKKGFGMEQGPDDIHGVNSNKTCSSIKLCVYYYLIIWYENKAAKIRLCTFTRIIKVKNGYAGRDTSKEVSVAQFFAWMGRLSHSVAPWYWKLCFCASESSLRMNKFISEPLNSWEWTCEVFWKMSQRWIGKRPLITLYKIIVTTKWFICLCLSVCEPGSYSKLEDGVV